MPDALLPVIWVSLSTGLVVVLVALGWRLARAVVALFRALNALVGTSAILDGVEPTRHLDRPVPAVLADRSELQARSAARHDRAHEQRLVRRQARITRGRLLTRPDVASVERMRRTWPHG